MHMVQLGNQWDELLEEEFVSDYYQKLRQFLKSEYRSYTIYPSMYDIFNALRYTDYGNVRAVILGQDPYHGPGQAHGLAFSVKKGVPVPPSLRNIFEELKNDMGIAPPPHGNLEAWAAAGVLLLNTVLTVREGQPNSHCGQGWETFTDNVIRLLNRREQPMVFILWGANARNKTALITNSSHLILTSPHPSPLSATRGFFGSKPFSQTNDFLCDKGGEINWRIN